MPARQAQPAQPTFAEHWVQALILVIKCLLPLLWLQSKLSALQFTIGSLLVLITWNALNKISPPHQRGEPDLVEPKVPVVGHIWGLLTRQVNYLSEIYTTTRLPIVTLPIANHKVYVVYDAKLQQEVLKSKDMDAQSFMVDFVPRIFGVKEGTMNKLLGKDGIHPNIMTRMEGIFRYSLSGPSLREITTATLGELAKTLNSIDRKSGVEVPNLFVWFRNLLTQATSRALWGEKHNPYSSQDIIDAQWDFEENMSPLVLGFLPRIIARKAYLARSKVQAAIEPFYRGRHDLTDPTVSNFVRSRSRLLREYDVPDDELAKNEMAITLVATTNALSSLFWCVAEIFTDPSVLEMCRKDLYEVVFGSATPQTPPRGGANVFINVKEIEDRCYLIISCYREAIRLASQIVTTRRVVRDTVILGRGGKPIHLKANTNVMMPAKVVHRNESVWGENPDEFHALRCMFIDDPTNPAMRNMKASFVPFGGGRHLCPGRHLAFKENVGIMAALILGFEIHGLDKEKLVMGDSKRGETVKPVPGFEGGKVVIKRREGWEGVVWGFEY